MATSDPKNVPVLFIFFNRPEHALRVFGKIREWKPSAIYLASDGPRDTKTGEAETVLCLREKIESLIDWGPRVERRYSSVNYGCARKVSDSISWVLAENEFAIILEDDCLPGEEFFDFTAQMLIRYASDERVGVVSGARFSQQSHWGALDGEFCRVPSIWGWGTWARVWRSYDLYCAQLDEEDIIKVQRYAGFKKYNPNIWLRLLDQIRAQPDFTWDYQLVLLVISSRYLVVVPTLNLIENIGYGMAATHTTTPIGRFVIKAKRVHNKLYNKKKDIRESIRYTQFMQDEYYGDSNSVAAVLFKIKLKTILFISRVCGGTLK